MPSPVGSYRQRQRRKGKSRAFELWGQFGAWWPSLSQQKQMTSDRGQENAQTPRVISPAPPPPPLAFDVDVVKFIVVNNIVNNNEGRVHISSNWLYFELFLSPFEVLYIIWLCYIVLIELRGPCSPF